MAVTVEQIDGKNPFIRKLRIGVIDEYLVIETQIGRSLGYPYANLSVLTFSLGNCKISIR